MNPIWIIVGIFVVLAAVIVATISSAKDTYKIGVKWDDKFRYTGFWRRVSTIFDLFSDSLMFGWWIMTALFIVTLFIIGRTVPALLVNLTFGLIYNITIPVIGFALGGLITYKIARRGYETNFPISEEK